MKNNLWIGSYVDKEVEKELTRKGCRMSSAFNVQRKLLQGLNMNGVQFDTLSVYPSVSPWIRNLFVHFDLSNRSENVKDQAISFFNIPFFHRFSKLFGLTRKAREWWDREQGDNVVVYGLVSLQLLVALSLKRKHNVNVVVLVPDLPEYMSNSRNKIYRFLKAIDRKVIDYCIQHVDGFVLFSEQMKTRLPLGESPYSVMEGVLELDETQYLKNVQCRFDNTSKIALLSGNLDIEDGVLDLINVFMKTADETYQLWITGSGNAEEQIKQVATQDKRIRYYGYIESYDEFLTIQRGAKVFVLMTSLDHPKSSVYFPSKIMEYLMTGGVVLCYKLQCFPKEYDSYLHYFEEGDESRCLRDAFDMMPEKVQEEALARLPFMKTKSSKEQAKKILQFLKY